ncbi:MAG: hypothetical protein ACK40I_01165 [Tabrizicola sp.]
MVFRDGDEPEPYPADDGRSRFALVEAGKILVNTRGTPFVVVGRKGGAEGATLVIAIMPEDARINVPLKGAPWRPSCI